MESIYEKYFFQSKDEIEETEVNNAFSKKTLKYVTNAFLK